MFHLYMRANERVNGLPLGDRCEIPCFKVDLVAELRQALPPDDLVEDLRGLFAALADATRIKILHALREGAELCVCDVAHAVEVSLSAASHHLRKLRDLRILKYRNDGKMAYYSLRDPLAAQIVGMAFEGLKP